MHTVAAPSRTRAHTHTYTVADIILRNQARCATGDAAWCVLTFLPCVVFVRSGFGGGDEGLSGLGMGGMGGMGGMDMSKLAELQEQMKGECTLYCCMSFVNACPWEITCTPVTAHGALNQFRHKNGEASSGKCIEYLKWVQTNARDLPFCVHT